MPLSILIEIINIMFSFPLTYTVISSEFVEVFKFINTYYKDLFFSDGCLGLTVMLGNVSLGLSAAIVKKAVISVMKVGIS